MAILQQRALDWKITTTIETPRLSTSPKSGKKVKKRVVPKAADVVTSDDVRTSPSKLPLLYRLKPDLLEYSELLFPHPAMSASHHKDTIVWQDSLATTVALNFATEACGGSKVRFEGTIAVVGVNGEKAEQKRSMLVHRPHPEPEVSLLCAFDGVLYGGQG